MSKKWCQYCRVNMDYNRDAIRKHQQSQLHIRNKQRQVNHQRRQAKKEHKNTSGYTLQFEKKQTTGGQGNMMEKPVPKLSEEQEKKEMIKKMKMEAMDDIKSKIHTFIAKKTEGKFGANIQYPEEAILTAEKYNTTQQPSNAYQKNLTNQYSNDSNSDQDDDQNQDSDEDDFKMWRIDLCSQTNKPCFINNITGAKLYQKPAGVILTQEQTNRWEQLMKEAQNKQQEQEEVNIGQWQQLQQGEDIFVANAVKQKSQQSDKNQDNQDDIQEDIQELRKQLLNSNTISDKSRTMKKLIMTGKEETVSMSLFGNNIQKKNEEKYETSNADLKKTRGFLPRKKIKGMTIMTGEEFE